MGADLFGSVAQQVAGGSGKLLSKIWAVFMILAEWTHFTTNGNCGFEFILIIGTIVKITDDNAKKHKFKSIKYRKLGF
jgi:hypothetical protein